MSDFNLPGTPLEGENLFDFGGSLEGNNLFNLDGPLEGEDLFSFFDSAAAGPGGDVFFDNAFNAFTEATDYVADENFNTGSENAELAPTHSANGEAGLGSESLSSAHVPKSPTYVNDLNDQTVASSSFNDNSGVDLENPSTGHVPKSPTIIDNLNNETAASPSILENSGLGSLLSFPDYIPDNFTNIDDLNEVIAANPSDINNSGLDAATSSIGHVQESSTNTDLNLDFAASPSIINNNGLGAAPSTPDFLFDFSADLDSLNKETAATSFVTDNLGLGAANPSNEEDWYSFTANESGAIPAAYANFNAGRAATRPSNVNSGIDATSSYSSYVPNPSIHSSNKKFAANPSAYGKSRAGPAAPRSSKFNSAPGATSYFPIDFEDSEINGPARNRGMTHFPSTHNSNGRSAAKFPADPFHKGPNRYQTENFDEPLDFQNLDNFGMGLASSGAQVYQPASNGFAPSLPSGIEGRQGGSKNPVNQTAYGAVNAAPASDSYLPRYPEDRQCRKARDPSHPAYRAPIYPAFKGKFKNSADAKVHRKRIRAVLKEASDLRRAKQEGREYWVKRIYDAMINIDNLDDEGKSIHMYRFQDKVAFEADDLEAVAHHVFDKAVAVHEKGFTWPLIYRDKAVRKTSAKFDKSWDSLEHRLSLICDLLSSSKAACDDVIRGGVTLALTVDNPTARLETKRSNNKSNKQKSARLRKAATAKQSEDPKAAAQSPVDEGDEEE
jgi:hypothetical protein